MLEAECCGGAPGPVGTQLCESLREIALAALYGMDDRNAGARLRQDGTHVELTFPGTTSPRGIAVQFVEALRGTTRRHDADCDPADALRIRMALGVQAAVPAGRGTESGELNATRNLVDAPVIRRVLAAEPAHILALIASEHWYDAFIRAGHAPPDGYQHVQVVTRTYRGTAWVNVPGQSRPHGLLPADAPNNAPPVDRPGARNIVAGGSHGIVIQSEVINGGVYIANRYDDGRQDGEDGR